MTKQKRGRRSREVDWESKETADRLCIRMEMPGVRKKAVKVLVERNTLIIKGEAEEWAENEVKKYKGRIDLPEVYKTNEIKAEMKDVVLKVLVPKMKEEETNDVFHVTVI